MRMGQKDLTSIRRSGMRSKHIAGLHLKLAENGIRDYLPVLLYPSFNEIFNPETSTVLSEYGSLLTDRGRRSFMPLIFEELFDAMEKCGMDEIDAAWIPYLKRRYIP